MKIKIELLFLICIFVDNIFFSFSFSDMSKYVSAYLYVTSTNDLKINIKKICDNSEDFSIVFDSVSWLEPSWSALSSQYLQLKVENNTVGWRLRIYSNNFITAPNTSIWGYQFGGLKGEIEGTKIAMGWKCSNSIIDGGPIPGDPKKSTWTVVDGGWTYLKDIWDVDIPYTTEADESFIKADKDGYCNIAFGDATYTRIVVPNNDEKSIQLPRSTDPFYLYFNANTRFSTAGNYFGKIILELINQ